MQDGDGSANGTILEYRAGAGERPLVLLPPIGGVVFTFALLARTLRSTLPVIALEDPRLNDTELDLPSIPALADVFVDDLLRAYPHGGPWRLAGYSFGGMVALEVARRFVERGEAVESVLLLDGGAGGAGGAMPVADYVVFMVREFLDHRPEMDDYWFEADRLIEEGHAAAVEYMTRAFFGRIEPEGQRWVERLLAVVDVHGRHAADWSAAELPDVPVHLLRTKRNRPAPDDLGWSACLGRALDGLRWLPGTHGSIMRAPDVEALARTIEAILDEGAER